jgi:dolichyl-phosphate-mannose--protein O-mannosyl transferase
MLQILPRRGLDTPTFAIAAGFFMLGLFRLTELNFLIFDEKFYVPTSILLGQGVSALNREHPPFAKELLALWFHIFGVSSATWRLLPLLCGSIAIYAAAAAMRDWRAGRILAGLLALSGLLYVVSRLALLEPFYFLFCALGTWAFVERRIAVAGVLLGLAVACKWSAVPLLACLFAIHAIRRPQQAVILLGVLPATVYFLTFIPLALVSQNPLSLINWFDLQLAMADRHGFVDPPHPYGSHVWNWLLGGGHMWIGTHDNPVLMLVNPAIALLTLPAVAFGLWKRWPEALLFCVLIAWWALTPKANQFVYHHLVPATFGMAVLVRAIAPRPRLAIGVLTAAAAMFAFLLPAYLGHALPLHRQLWPISPHSLPILNPEQRVRFDRLEHCLYHPAECRQ